jgi:hypothetical protein
MPDKPVPKDLRNGDEYVKRLSKLAAQRRLRRAAERREKSLPADADTTKTPNKAPPR